MAFLKVTPKCSNFNKVTDPKGKAKEACVYLHIHSDSKNSKLWNTGLKANKTNWDNKAGQFTTHDAYSALDKYQEEAKKFILKSVYLNSIVTPEDVIKHLDCLFKGKAEDKESVIITMEYVLNEIIEREKSKNECLRTGKLASTYYRVYAHVLNILQKQGLANILIKDFGKKEAEVFMRYFTKNNLNETTPLKTIKTVFNKAISEKYYSDENPFKSYKPQKRESKDRGLGKADIDKVISYDTSKLSNAKQRMFDYVLLCYYTGLAPIDLFRLKPEHLNLKHRIINITRQKSNVTAFPPLTSECLALLNKYALKHDKEAYLLPPLRGVENNADKIRSKIGGLCQRINRMMKDISEELKLPIVFQMYSGRHSFCNVLLDKGISPSDIAQMMGNSPEMIYKHYTNRITPDKINYAASLL